MWPWAQPPQMTILDVASYSHPNFLKESSCFDYIYLPPTGPTLNRLVIFCTTATPKLLLPRSKAHVSFNMLTTSWYFPCLILGCLKCHWLLRIMSHFGVCELAVSPPSFYQFHGSSSYPLFSLLLLCSSLGDVSPSGLSSLALYPRTPARFHQHLGFSYYHLYSADCWRRPLMFLLASVSNIFCPAPANFLVTAPAFPLRTSPCPYCQHGWFNGTTWVVMGPGPSSCFLTIEIALRMDTHIIQSEVSQKEKHQYSILTHIYGI